MAPDTRHPLEPSLRTHSRIYFKSGRRRPWKGMDAPNIVWIDDSTPGKSRILRMLGYAWMAMAWGAAIVLGDHHPVALILGAPGGWAGVVLAWQPWRGYKW